jgi:hypothetical protein
VVDRKRAHVARVWWVRWVGALGWVRGAGCTTQARIKLREQSKSSCSLGMRTCGWRLAGSATPWASSRYCYSCTPVWVTWTCTTCVCVCVCLFESEIRGKGAAADGGWLAAAPTMASLTALHPPPPPYLLIPSAHLPRYYTSMRSPADHCQAPFISSARGPARETDGAGLLLRSTRRALACHGAEPGAGRQCHARRCRAWGGGEAVSW